MVNDTGDSDNLIRLVFELFWTLFFCIWGSGGLGLAHRINSAAEEKEEVFHRRLVSSISRFNTQFVF